MELAGAWTKLVVRWAQSELARGESDEQLEDITNIMDQETSVRPKDIMTSSVFITLTLDLLYKCNYAATLEGILLNKMIVDTVYMAPNFIPYWVKSVIFFMITLPHNLFTLVDDLVAGLLIFQRFNAHGDLFDVGIVVGKVVRILFQGYFGIYMLWDYMLQYINIDINWGQ